MNEELDALHGELVRSAYRLIAFLEENRESEGFDYPFGHAFPRNCCESVSMIFSYLAVARYGLEDVAVIRGTDPERYEHHFWVSAGGRVYDLTAHQFPGYRPVLGEIENPLSLRFSEHCEMHEPEFVDRGEVIDLFRRGIIPF